MSFLHSQDSQATQHTTTEHDTTQHDAAEHNTVQNSATTAPSATATKNAASSKMHSLARKLRKAHIPVRVGKLRWMWLRKLRPDDIVIVKQQEVRRAVLGTAVGNFMEWYDFGIYGYLAVVMTSVFTRDMPQSLGLLVMLLGFAVSFLARPIGGMILGPLGDRIGRKKVLFLTMSIMAGATALIGVLPTAAQLGIWAPLPLYALKIIQGFSTGGEYAGSATYVTESSSDKRRGFYSSWLDIGSYLGFAAGAGVVALTSVLGSQAYGEGFMLNGGWRIPYLSAVPLAIIAILIRTHLPETPQFDQAPARPAYRAHKEGSWKIFPIQPRKRSKKLFAPHSIPALLRDFKKEILCGIVLVAATNTLSYVLTSYMPTYLENVMGINQVQAAVATIPTLIVVALLLPVAGLFSDHFGRKRLYTVAGICSIVCIVPAFMLLHTNNMTAVHIALLMLSIPAACYIAASVVTIPSLFPTASRFSAMAFTYNIGVSLFGGTAPLIVQALIEVTGNSYMPAWYVGAFSVFGLVATWYIPETAGAPMIGSMPTVESKQEALELVHTQDENPLVDIHTMPVPAIATVLETRAVN